GWCDELGLPRLFPHLYAYQIYTVDTDEKKKYFDKIANTSDAYPQAGDIVVWSKSYNGTAGHTAVATGLHQTQGKSSDWFEAFSQNDPTGSPCILKKYSYNNVLGWLRPKKELIKFDDYYKGLDLNNKESMKACVDIWHDVMIEKKWIRKEEYDNAIQEKETYYQSELLKKDQTIANLNSQITQLEKDKNTLSDELKQLQSQLENVKECPNQLIDATKQLNQAKLDYEKAKGDWQIKEQGYLKTINTLKTKYDKMKGSSLKKILLDYIYGKS
ncbi:MAG: CHAP domain-containing protein, partial [Thermoplasmata archaeon]